MNVSKFECLSYHNFRSFYTYGQAEEKVLILAFEVPNEKQGQHLRCEPISNNSRHRVQVTGRFGRQIFSRLSYRRKYRIDLCSQIKPIAYCGLFCFGIHFSLNNLMRKACCGGD